jgi:hypothetical protein
MTHVTLDARPLVFSTSKHPISLAARLLSVHSPIMTKPQLQTIIAVRLNLASLNVNGPHVTMNIVVTP